MMTVTVLFFAQARERAGRSSVAIDLPEGSRLADAIARVREQHPALDPLWSHLAVALDGQLAPPDTALRPGAEVALLPPVSGG